MKNRFLRALLRQPVDTTPIWVMRQAGRYLPEYRQLRQQAGSFMQLCKTPELACQVTLQPLARFDLDAAILFSDILTIPDAMGLGLHFVAGEGPRFEKPLQSASDIMALTIPDPYTTLSYVPDAVRLIKQNLPEGKPLIGFAGSPWTLACYMLQGGSSKDFAKVRGMIYRDPNSLQLLLSKLSEAVAAYLTAQIEAGVDAIMIFDTWGGLLSPQHFTQYSAEPMATILEQVPCQRDEQVIPRIVFTKQGGPYLETLADIGAHALGLDWTIDIAEAFERVGDRVALQGNLDPAALYGSDENLQASARAILQAVSHRPGHIFNLGHGITPDIDPEKVKLLVETVHSQ